MQRVCAAIVAVCFTASALAQGPQRSPPPSVVVFAFPVEPKDAADAQAFEASFETALANAGIPLAPLGELFPDESAPSLTRGEQLFEQGRRLFDALDCARAARRFQEAIAFYAKHPAHIPPKVFATAYLFLGGCRFLDGDRAAALEAFSRAALIDRTAEPDATLFAQDVLDAWRDAARAVEARNKGQLVVDASPPGSELVVRGQPVGRSPALAPLDVPTGTLLVQVTRPGHQTWGALTEIVADRPSGVVATLPQVPALSAMREVAATMATEQSFAAAALPPEAAAVADRMGARFLLLARVKDGVARAQVWDAVTGNRLKGLDVEARGAAGQPLEEPAQAVRDWLKNPSPMDVGASLTASSLVKKWWFWTAIAGAAAVTGVVVYAATRPKPPPPMEVR